MEKKAAAKEMEEVNTGSRAQEEGQEDRRQLPWHITTQYSVLSLVLLDRLDTIIDPQLMEAQCGF